MGIACACRSLLLTAVLAAGAPASAQQAPAPAASMGEFGRLVQSCIARANLPAPPPGASMTINFSISSQGALMAEPRLVVTRGEVAPQFRDFLRVRLVEAMKACAPFPVTPAFGRSIAGRLLRFRATSKSNQQGIWI